MAYKPAPGINPLTQAYYYTDFVEHYGNTWTTVVGGSASLTDTQSGTPAGHPGVVQLQVSGAFASSGMGLAMQIALGGGSIINQHIVQIPVLGSATNRINLQFGLMDSVGGFTNTQPQNGCYFQYQDNQNSGKWQCITTSGGVSTTSDSGVTTNTNYNNFKIAVDAAGTNVYFYINETLVATNTTNLPSSLLMGGIALSCSSADTSNNVLYDMFYFLKNLSTSR